jgi:ABC-2 type transport system ATP-binding protein
MAVIEVQGLEKHYGAHAALGGVDFAIEAGEIVGFLGPNGAGKSTTMKILTGFVSASAGEARIKGLDVLEDPVEARRHLGYLPEAAPVYPDMRVGEYLDFVGRVRGLAAAERTAAVDRAIARCGLGPRRDQIVGTLSKGYKQRVGIAQAILHDPDILILDEPTSGLDPNQIVDIRALIREIGQRKTVILSTHILSEVQATCDRVIIIHAGKLVADGPTDEVTRTGSRDVLHVSLAPGKVRTPPERILAELGALDGVDEVRDETGTVEVEGQLDVRLAVTDDVRAQVFAVAVKLGVVLLEMRRERRNLEEVFRQLTTG